MAHEYTLCVAVFPSPQDCMPCTKSHGTEAGFRVVRTSEHWDSHLTGFMTLHTTSLAIRDITEDWCHGAGIKSEVYANITGQGTSIASIQLVGGDTEK